MSPPAGDHPHGCLLRYTPSKGGVFRVTLELDSGREYQFRYLVNGQHWCNHWHADAYVPGGLGQDNCVVVTPTEALAIA